MVRVQIICEGQTEEQFVNEVLQPYFSARGVFLSASLIGTGKHKGGRVSFVRLADDVRRFLVGDKARHCTTFFDFYGLPNDFPGRAIADKKATYTEKAQAVEQALQQALAAQLDDHLLERFIPYVQMYEFEALLFSHPQKFAQGIAQPQLEAALQKIRDAFSTPEEINDSPQTAPSKRILQLMANYEKPLYGTLAALHIELPIIRKECQHFDAWLMQLESLAKR